jgi:hypothetical protein
MIRDAAAEITVHPLRGEFGRPGNLALRFTHITLDALLRVFFEMQLGEPAAYSRSPLPQGEQKRFIWRPA